MNCLTKSKMFTLVGLAVACTTGPVSAQSVLEGEAGEIVVTAQKREQSIQKVGIAISAFSGEQLRALNVTDSRAIAAITPGVHLGGAAAGQNSQYTIRGVTQNDFNDIVEAPNAVYLDEAYIAIGQGQSFALFDIDRVEVLKGPQGTLFGRNATGGLVHYVTRKPSLTKVEGFLDINGGIYDSVSNPLGFRIEGAVSIPLSEKVAQRFAVYWNKRQPLLRNLYPQGAVGGSPGPDAGADMDDDDTLAGRSTTLFEPSDTARITLQFNAARSRVSTAPYQSKPTIAVFDAGGELVNVIDVSPTETRGSIGAAGQDFGTDVNNDGVFGDSFGRAPGADLFGYRDPDGSGFTTSSDFAFKRQGRIRTYGANVTGDFELGDTTTLTSVTDYKHFFKRLFIDVDSGPGNQAANYQGVKAWTLSQELRLSGKTDSLNWVAGIYFLHIDNNSINGLKFPIGSVVPGTPFDLGLEAHLITNSYSAFGQVDWKFTETLTLVAGARVIQEKKKYDFFQGIYGTTNSRQVQVGPAIVIGPDNGQPYSDNRSETLWAGKVQLEYTPNADLLIYAGVNRGVKASSFNAQLAGGLAVPASSIRYKPEILTSIEGGFKYTFPDRRTRLNASAYYYDYKDYQAFLFTGVSGIVINADARTYGLEGSIFTSPMRGLDLGLAVSWFDSKVKDVPLRVGGPISRNVEPTYAPPVQINAIARYEWDGMGGKLSIGGDVGYTASFYYNLRNFDADKYGDYIMANAGIGWTNDSWELNLRIKNITNVRAGIQGFDLASFCGCNELSFKPPRYFELGARYNF